MASNQSVSLASLAHIDPIDATCDVLIVGGGCIGLATAIALAPSGMRIALIEADEYEVVAQKTPQQPAHNTPPERGSQLNDRASSEANLPAASRLFALSQSSCDFFSKIDVLDQITACSEEMRQISVVEQGQEEALIFLPEEVSLAHFGFMCSENDLKSILRSKLIQINKNSPNLQIFSGYYAQSLRYNDAYPIPHSQNSHADNKKDKFPAGVAKKKGSNIQVQAYAKASRAAGSSSSDENARHINISADFLIAADGRNSKLRDFLGIATKFHDYQQIAIVCDIDHEFPHHGVALEKFCPQGPFAVLPRRGGYSSSLVWTEAAHCAPLFESIDKKAITQLLQNKMQGYLGNFSFSSKIAIFPLSHTVAKQYWGNRAVIIGDAAHFIHPVAGQGINLGFRDVSTISALLCQRYRVGLPLFERAAMQDYQRQRRLDVEMMLGFTRHINGLFSSKNLAVRRIRGLGLQLFNSLPLVKTTAMRYASGLLSEVN